MRAFELLSEAGLKIGGMRQSYLDNLIKLISTGKPVPVTPDVQDRYGKTVIIDPTEAQRLQQISDETAGRLNSKNYLDIQTPIGNLKLQSPKGKTISFGNIEKSPEIKGIGDDYNVGDVGEIALGVSVALAFMKAGQPFSVIDFVKTAQGLNIDKVLNAKGKVLKSLKLTYSGTIQHSNGKKDNLTITILAPGRSVTAFKRFMDEPGSTPNDIRGAILSALEYAKNEEKIKAGLEQSLADSNTNTIEVLCDGVSDQKGTKADLEYAIDGKRINLISAKTGPSQLGQASGHDWKKQKTFFSVVFQEDVSAFEQSWGTTNKEHLDTLIKIYQTAIIPKIQKLTGGDSVQKEIELVRSISNGLIRYANNFDEETGKIETVDIVKLIVDPGSPGFKLMKIDEKLSAALEKADLVGAPTQNKQGVEVHGMVNGKKLLLFKARAYYSAAADVVRNIIEGGPFLDELATVPAAPPVDKSQPAKKTVAKPQTTVPTQPSKTAAQQPQTPQTNI